MGKRLGALLLVLPLSGAGLAAARLPSRAATYSAGAVTAGAVPGGPSPVTVQRQEITLSIPSLPSADGESNGYVETASVLRNPTDETVTLKMFLPEVPRQDGRKRDAEYAVEVDGNPVQTALRHSYVGYYNRAFDLEEGLTQLAGETGGFYGEAALPVHDYRFHIDLPRESFEGNGRKYLSIVLTFDCNPEKTRVMSCDRMYSEVVNGRVRASFDVEAGESDICLSVAGEDIGHLVYGVYTDRYLEQKVEIGSLSYRETSSTLQDYAMSFCPPESAISADDWYHGFVQMLAGSTTDYLVYKSPASLKPEAFMSWLEYTLVLPARTDVLHTTRAPLYPDVEEKRCDYFYMLSSQKKWSSFGPVSISVETPYYLAYSTLDFQMTETGYRFERDCLPLGDLGFTVTETEEDFLAISGNIDYDPLSPSLRLAYILIGSLGGVAVIAAVCGVVIAQKRKRGRKRTE